MRRLAAILLRAVIPALIAGAALADTPGTAPPAPGPTAPAPPAAAPPVAAPPAITVPAGATPISAAEFESYFTGKTFAYSQDGIIWGRETYLPGRRVMWRAVGEACKLGHWWPANGAICFGYDDGKTDQCWAFARGPEGLTATFLGKAGSLPASVTEEKDPVPCPGPAIGS